MSLEEKLKNNLIKLFDVVIELKEKECNHWISNVVLIPKIFFDKYLDKLSSTEIHVLCAMFKHSFAQNKTRCVMSLDELCDVTNLNFEEVESAYNKLIDKKIILE